MREALQPCLCVPLLGLWDAVKEFGLSVGDIFIPESTSAGNACVSSYPFWGARDCLLGSLVKSFPHFYLPNLCHLLMQGLISLLSATTALIVHGVAA